MIASTSSLPVRLHGAYSALKCNLVLTDEEKKNFALIELEKILNVQNKSLKDFHPMPVPSLDNSRLVDNKLLFEELSYDRQQLLQESKTLSLTLTYEPRKKIFMEGVVTLRTKGEIVLNVTSSGISYLLLPSGQTAHSRFAIPISINEDSTCNIKQGSHLAELVVKTSLIIWDEAPMMHKHCFEALDRTMRDLLRFVNPYSGSKTFGSKTVVLGGDFHQILPVIPKGTRQDIVASTINSSYLWNNCKVLRLTKNLRLNSVEAEVDIRALEDFSNWIASIGDDKIGGLNDGYVEFEIPSHMLLTSTGDHIATIVKSTFPMFLNGNFDPSYLQCRAILAPMLDVVNSVNEFMSALHTSESRTYFSCDTVCKADSNNGILDDVHTRVL
ncbi:uncharacterized protein LOC116016083 [Ipomoea triloba]|uniref:uncharacterized protein LOC116016083 n=1 Tax=Ipomoea triloba TaxID=35885 RepID=UPI00125D8427|nr:uncharacterized protein LOC116016083 [Ipomoea triloba]